MAETIALRNVALFTLTVLLLWHFRRQKRIFSGIPFRWTVPIMLWAVYVCLFPFFSELQAEAFYNLWTIWFRSLMALAVGAGVAIVLFGGQQRGTALQLGLVTFFPILVHLSLVGWKFFETSAIPWRYWGRETHHADLGYAAGQAVVLLSAALLADRARRSVWVVTLMGASFLSLIVARSRGGIVFAFVGLVFVLVASVLGSSRGRRPRMLFGLLVVLGVAIAVIGLAVKNDARWLYMADRLSAGFHGDALKIQCEGAQRVEAELIAKYGEGSRTRDLIASVADSDGARTVLMRAGLTLALDHPWGLDGSRQAFNKRLKEHCANPAIQMAHTHNGWLDTALALGWGGAVLYAWILINFLMFGMTRLDARGNVSEWALVLVALSGFWILRGFFDSVYRDHQLEMQGFVLAYAAVSLSLNRRVTLMSEVSDGSRRTV